MDGAWIFRDHSAKLYLFLDDFARVGGGCQRLTKPFQAISNRNCFDSNVVYTAIWQNL
jgi:hypothetical protein